MDEKTDREFMAIEATFAEEAEVIKMFGLYHALMGQLNVKDRLNWAKETDDRAEAYALGCVFGTIDTLDWVVQNDKLYHDILMSNLQALRMFLAKYQNIMYDSMEINVMPLSKVAEMLKALKDDDKPKRTRKERKDNGKNDGS